MGTGWSSLWGLFSPPKDTRVLILGLDNAGKTTILYRLKTGEIISTMPTIGFNLETITVKGMTLSVWDLGGQTSIRPYWRCYYNDTAAIIFVVDSTDVERLGQAQEELTKMLNEPELRDTPLLVLANKQDAPGARDAAEISQALKLPLLQDRNWNITACSALDTSQDALQDRSRNVGGRNVLEGGKGSSSGLSKGLDEGMEWLSKVLGGQ